MEKEQLYFVMIYVCILLAAAGVAATLFTGGTFHGLIGMVPFLLSFVFIYLYKKEIEKKDKK